MEILTLEIKSRFGSFTKPTSTTGGLLTYKIPPKPAIKGILGAILGFNFKETRKYLENLKVGVKPLTEINTKTTTFNSHHGNPRGRMVNIKQEILVKPHYKVYADFSGIKKNKEALEKILKNFKDLFHNTPNSIYEAIRMLCKNKSTYYTPYMGRNNFPLEFKLIDDEVTEFGESFKEEVEVDSVVPREICADFKIQETLKDGDEELGLNISIPNNLKVYILKDMPIDQEVTREYAQLKDFLLKSHPSDTRLFIEPKPLQEKYNFLKSPEDKLITLY